MVDIKNALEIINDIILIPLALIAFLLLIYIVFYLNKKDPDVIRSRIFLKYNEFKKAFILLAAFAFILILHVLLIYIHHYLLEEEFIEDIQRFFGLILALIMVEFVYVIFRCMK